ncbi:MAG: NYN domain-containing protein, partial [Alphaproteobacteria bacterium]|nr:NYN domain-containing protein [Alphaproteobacteria bacterium]
MTKNRANNGNYIPFYNEEKIAVFIDGSNLYAAARALDFDIDYRLLLQWVSARGRLMR